MIRVYKTFEISDDLWAQIADGFNESFEGHSTTSQSLKESFYVRNQWGYAYHAVASEDNTGELIGFTTYTPNLYMDNLKILVSGSSFVRKKFRKDIFVFLDMINELKDKCSEEGFVVGLGVSNHNSLEYSLKFLGGILVGYLDYYILPVNISKCLRKKCIQPFNGISRFFAKMYLELMSITSMIHNAKEKQVKYALLSDEDYLNARFPASIYKKYEKGNCCAYFRIVEETEANNVRTAYLLDFRENGVRTKKALTKAVRFIVKNEICDAVMFVGWLRLKQHVLIKVPKRFIPKPLPLTYGPLNKKDKKIYEDMSDMNNWNFSLMNFDVR